VLESLAGRGPLLLVLGQQLCDEVLSVIGDVTPHSVLEGELAEFHLLHDLLVRRTIKGRDSRKGDVRDDTARPDITLGSIVLGEDLRSDVIRGSELLIKLLVLVEDQRRSEVNDLDLVEFLILLQKDIFWFQISVHDMVRMAVVNTGEDLFHEHRGVLLCELASGHNLIEELTSFTDVCYDIISFLVLEEFVHLQDVGMI